MTTRTTGRLTTFQIITLGFTAAILIGTLLLMLPQASQNGASMPFINALFTSVSAVCVTGLVVCDTATAWSAFGQAVILMLIQIGGLGVITVAVSFAMLSGRKISLMQRSTMQDAISAPKVGGIVRLTGFALKATVLFELAGALAMAPVFVGEYGPKGVWMALFHSVSAFCNAGFDLMGRADAQYVSLVGYAQNTVVNITVMVLIVIGGIGFITWEDVYTNGLRFRRYRMQSKVIITMTLCLIAVPAVFFFFMDFAGLSLKERVLVSLFQAVTPRTAGFNTANLAAMSNVGQALTVALMLIGGSPCSAAGGMKTTTLAVLVANAAACFARRDDPHLFGRRISPDTVKNAATVLMMYLLLFFVGAVIISTAEHLPMGVCLYEAASAVSTVGLSMGLTPTLGTVSQLTLIVLMFLGRVGSLTLIYAALSPTHRNLAKLPQETITVG